MTTWYKFAAYNTETQYGYGTEKQAERYADHLNKGREINVYGFEPVTDVEQIAEIEKGYGYGFNLDDFDLED